MTLPRRGNAMLGSVIAIIGCAGFGMFIDGRSDAETHALLRKEVAACQVSVASLSAALVVFGVRQPTVDSVFNHSYPAEAAQRGPLAGRRNDP